LPERNGKTMPADFSRHAKTLVEQYGLANGLFQLRVRASSPFAGKPRTDIDLSPFPSLALMSIQEKETGNPLRRPHLIDGDILLSRGDAQEAAAFAAETHLSFRDDQSVGSAEDALFNARSGLAEVLIAPRSKLVGQSIFPGMVTESGDLIILAVQRGGE